MSELMRFRLARAPQKQAVDPALRVPLFRHPPADLQHAAPERELPSTMIAALLQDPAGLAADLQLVGVTLLEQPATLRTPILLLDAWLTSLQNRPNERELANKLAALGRLLEADGAPPTNEPQALGPAAQRLLQLAGNDWWRDRQNLGANLLLSLASNIDPSLAMYFNRLLLVVGLVELAAEHPNRLQTADDILWALRARSVALPRAVRDFLCSGGRWISNWARGTSWQPLVGDFNGDGKDDIAARFASTGDWQVALSDQLQFKPAAGSGAGHWLQPWAVGTQWVPFVGDFDGDGKDDIAVWFPATGDWQVALSDGTRFVTSDGSGGGHWLQPWATGLDWIPLIGDFNGDGKDDIAVWHPATGNWQVALSNGTHFVATPAADGGDWLNNWAQGREWVPLVGDFDGDGMDDIAVWHPNTGSWQVALSTGSGFAVSQGGGGNHWIIPWAVGREWVPLVGDFDGDGKDDIAVWHPATGDWQVALSEGYRFVPAPGAGGGHWLTRWGQGVTPVPMVGDFNGDGKDDIALWYPASGNWEVALSGGTKFVKRRRCGSLARRPGFSDLYITRDEWVSYEAGEIAHIENVMASEVRERSHTRLTETEDLNVLDEERSKLDERDTQTTDRYELQEEASRDSRLNIGVEGSVDASGQYGAAKVSTHLGGSFDYSLEESQAQATRSAQEIIARAVVRVEERVRQSRSRRSLSRIEEVNKHAFKNDAPGSTSIAGVYRWVDKIKRVQVFRYPNRFILEFQVPEPGAWLRWLLGKERSGTLSEKPAEFTKNGNASTPELTASDITPDTYIELGARYKTIGLVPPPRKSLVTASFNQNTSSPRKQSEIRESDPLRFLKLGDISIPNGYAAKRWYTKIQGWGEDSHGRGRTVTVLLMLGHSQVHHGLSRNNDPSPFEGETGPTSIDGVIEQDTNPGIEQTILPLSVKLDNVRGFIVHVTIECEPSETALMKWKFDTYEKIAQAYYAMKRQYDEELAAQSVRSGVQIEGLSPAQNAEMARAELKKAVIELITEEDFWGRNAIQRYDTANNPMPPEIDLARAALIAPEVQFLEQAFEWENLSYVLYPYFWADKGQWGELADLSGPDPDFARFLRAGSARVIVPARPGFANQVWLYTSLGLLWGGGPAPAPDDDEYLSIADEIRAQEKPPRDGIPGESWEVRLPTSLVWLDPGNTTLPVVNQRMQLDPPPGKVLV